jgi:hypothetical protein
METLHNDYISLLCIVSHGRQCANERYKWKHCLAGRINLRIEYLIDFTSKWAGPVSDKTRLLNFYLPDGFEKVITEFGVPATSRTLPPADLKGSGTPEQMKALFQRIGKSPVALPDVLRKPQ